MRSVGRACRKASVSSVMLVTLDNDQFGPESDFGGEALEDRFTKPRQPDPAALERDMTECGRDIPSPVFGLAASSPYGRKKMVQIATKAIAEIARLASSNTSTLGLGSACRASLGVSAIRLSRVLAIPFLHESKQTSATALVPLKERSGAQGV
jgi:hypothetical protein